MCRNSGTRQKQTGKQVLLNTVFKQPLPAGLDCVKSITNAIGTQTETFTLCIPPVFRKIKENILKCFKTRYKAGENSMGCLSVSMLQQVPKRK